MLTQHTDTKANVQQCLAILSNGFKSKLILKEHVTYLSRKSLSTTAQMSSRGFPIPKRAF